MYVYHFIVWEQMALVDGQALAVANGLAAGWLAATGFNLTFMFLWCLEIFVMTSQGTLEGGLDASLGEFNPTFGENDILPW